MKFTKIVATLSDKRCDPEFIRQLYEAGMNVVRLNTAHISLESALMMIQNVRSVSDNIGILVDTKGPEIRTVGVIDPIAVHEGDTIKVKGGQGQSTREILYVSYELIQMGVPVGNQILIDDGELAMTVIDKNDDFLTCKINNQGVIKNKKSINIPGITINLPSISEKDAEFIAFAAQQEVDFIAHSFVRNKSDVLAVQEILNQLNSNVKIISKIENLDGVNNIEEILSVSYGIMVARGDLGIEIPAEKIPGIQRILIRNAVQQKKPVIIATQMLHSMIDNPRPTRAEVSDVATAIYDRTDAVMLSGETAYGSYPVESVKVMAKIAREVESSKDRRNDLPVPRLDNETSAFLAEAAVLASKELKVTAIVTDTLTGKIARYIAAFRGALPVYAKCHNGRVKRELSLSYGVFPSEIVSKKNKHKLIETSLLDLVERNLITEQDTVVYVGGNFGVGGGTSFIEIASVERMAHAKMEG
ncbi:MAG TPA: pyruvate kinase [Prolixibacteraceae bacterium]|nr:pyruvate kinase [Prolixibacteraceae bacterium]